MRSILSHGYIIAVVDVRGSGASFGTRNGIFTPEEAQDTYDIVEWFAEQPWCDGNIGMYGGSYLGIDLPFYEGEALRDKKEPLKLFKKPSIKISAWIKSRMFDVLFIAGLWFVTLWIASYLTSVTVFQLISNSTLAVIVFFIILLSVYLFCFLFFLGETIGDYVFPKNDS